MDWFALVVGFIIGVSVCCLISLMRTIFFKKSENSIGTLKIDTKDPDGPYIFLELRSDIPELMRRKKVTLYVEKLRSSHE